MKKAFLVSTCAILGLVLLLLVPDFVPARCGFQTGDPHQWTVHDPDRPMPPVVTPAASGPQVPPPTDAVILFDGSDLSHWTKSKGQAAGWKVEEGYMEVVRKSGSIQTTSI